MLVFSENFQEGPCDLSLGPRAGPRKNSNIKEGHLFFGSVGRVYLFAPIDFSDPPGSGLPTSEKAGQTRICDLRGSRAFDSGL